MRGASDRATVLSAELAVCTPKGLHTVARGWSLRRPTPGSRRLLAPTLKGLHTLRNKDCGTPLGYEWCFTRPPRVARWCSQPWATVCNCFAVENRRVLGRKPLAASEQETCTFGRVVQTGYNRSSRIQTCRLKLR